MLGRHSTNSATTQPSEWISWLPWIYQFPTITWDMLINSLQQLILHAIFVLAKVIHFIILKNVSSHILSMIWLYRSSKAVCHHCFLQLYGLNHAQNWLAFFFFFLVTFVHLPDIWVLAPPRQVEPRGARTSRSRCSEYLTPACLCVHFDCFLFDLGIK